MKRAVAISTLLMLTAIVTPPCLGQQIITPTNATSTTWIGSGGRTIATTIDGSGLSSGGSSGNITNETHSSNDANDAKYWLSDSTAMGGAPTSATETLVFMLPEPSTVDTIIGFTLESARQIAGSKTAIFYFQKIMG